MNPFTGKPGFIPCRRTRMFTPVLVLGVISGCQTVDNSAGRPTVYQDVGTTGMVAGVGIEQQDIVSMTDRMMRDMLSSPDLAGNGASRRIILDGAYFTNDSSQRINKNLIVDRLRIELQRRAGGRFVFVGREYAGMVDEERRQKRSGVLDRGTLAPARARAGADFRLGGRISSLDAQDSRSGTLQRYNQIVFEMIDLETDHIVWGGIYEFSKAAQDHAVYR